MTNDEGRSARVRPSSFVVGLLILAWTYYSLSAHQVMFHGEQRGAGAGRDADLGVDMLDMVVGSLGRDRQRVGDLPGRVAAREQAQHLQLARAQAGNQRAPAG